MLISVSEERFARRFLADGSFSKDASFSKEASFSGVFLLRCIRRKQTEENGHRLLTERLHSESEDARDSAAAAFCRAAVLVMVRGRQMRVGSLDTLRMLFSPEIDNFSLA